MTLWMKISMDELELPEAIADSCKELAKECGVQAHSIVRHIGRCRKLGHRCCYVKVKVEDDEV